MRLTLPVYRGLIFLRKQLWAAKGMLKEPQLKVTPYLKETGVEIEDPNDWVREVIPEWEPPVKDDPRFASPPPETDHPDYHTEPVLQFNPRSRLLEGLNQVCLLTKTHPFYELPEQITDRIGAAEIKGQDELVQRYIMQANVWDSSKQKLPKRFDPSLPGWKFKAEHGIPKFKRDHIIQQNLLRLCQSLHGMSPDLAASRRLTKDFCLSTSYYFQNDKHIQVKAFHEWMISTNQPLAPFASMDEVDQSVSHELPDLFPVSPCIDLLPQHVYKVENMTGWAPGATHPVPHTLFVEDRNRWSVSQRNARYLMYCFAHCLALAKNKYGWDATTLPEPISTQCIGTNGESFSFVCFQLNTLNFDSTAGIKNFVWFDNDNLMYNKILPRRAMLRNTKYEDYDPSVFKKYLAFYVNGAELLKRA